MKFPAPPREIVHAKMLAETEVNGMKSLMVSIARVRMRPMAVESLEAVRRDEGDKWSVFATLCNQAIVEIYSYDSSAQCLTCVDKSLTSNFE